MLNAPKDTGKKIRAYLSILLVPSIPAVVGWEQGVCFSSSLFPIIWTRSSLGPSKRCRDEVLAAWFHGRPAVTSGVEAAACGMFCTSWAEEEATLRRLRDLGLEWISEEELPSAPPARGCERLTFPIPEILVEDWAFGWALDAGWELLFTRFLRFLSGFCREIKKKQGHVIEKGISIYIIYVKGTIGPTGQDSRPASRYHWYCNGCHRNVL